ncbi:hypothetical protein GO988_21515 [Hymenobacter sp. HMF4947]|uniref:Uncharacterized protein n=1 Tax=Hymenobacter ginkgonis TaxID=2682976 RepID=A0A7K1TKP6_9BACT|nr:hypothetical protein [Hymenobacter ginkgonis]MVN78916.1 hypothetical protein [Hymenobacter ginkgonis]
MSYVQLRRQILVNNTGLGAPYTATVDYFDTLDRKPITLQFDSQANDPAALAKGDEVFRYEYRPGKIRLVLYDGNGSVYTRNLVGANPTPGVGTALQLKVNPLNATTTDVNARNGCFDLTGQFGVAPYQLEVTGQGGQASGYHQTATSQFEIYPVRFYNLANGEYFVKVTDATGDFRTQIVRIGVAQYGWPRGSVLKDYYANQRLIRRWWLYNELNTLSESYFANQGNGSAYLAPTGTLVDAFLLPGSVGAVWRQVYADGTGEVYFVDRGTGTDSSLELDNLIPLNPDTEAEQNGGVLVEMLASAPPLTFSLPGYPSNQHGSFDGLGAGDFEVQVVDAVGKSVTVPFSLRARYGLRWYLDFSDLYGVPCRLELWLRDYVGEPELIKGQADPVIIKSDGLNSTIGGQGDLPSVVATSCQVNLKTPPDLLLDVETGDDTNCRVDVWRDTKLRFRGFVQTGLYDGELQAGLIDVSLTATDGLAGLKDTYFTGHVGQRLGGHRRLLSSQVHCLARTSIALPLHIYTNRRDAAMSDADAPELAATTNRLGYWDESQDEPIFDRAVLEALAQAEGGTLVQREGVWQVRSILEAAGPAAGRAYRPAGTPAGDRLAPAPTGLVEPSTEHRWYWLHADQAKEVRAGWKSLTGTTDAGWLKNAFAAGTAFSDPYAWLEDYSKLRPISGWRPGLNVLNFPLVLQRVGEKGKDHSTQWPRSTASKLPDSRYLESPALPLAAGLEAVPAYLTLTGKFLPSEFYTDASNTKFAAPTTAKQATLPYEFVVDGRPTGLRLATFALSAQSSDKDTTFEAPLDALPSGAGVATLRVYAWFAGDVGQLDSATPAGQLSPGIYGYDKGFLAKDDFGTGVFRLFVANNDDAKLPLTGASWTELLATNASTGQLLLSSVGVQLRPQGAIWDGEDNFRADGPAGNIRPTEALKVFHPDVPITAGLFGGNLDAFAKSIALADGTMSTKWARHIDLEPSPLLESNVYDVLSLRSGPSNLLTGTIRHENCEPPYLLDTIDTPYDMPGRRFCVGATEWHMKAAAVGVSLIQNGVGADAPNPYDELPDGVRVIDRLYQYVTGKYVNFARGTNDGSVRVRG